MGEFFKGFTIELDLQRAGIAAKKARKWMLKEGIQKWFDDAKKLMYKKGFFPWSKNSLTWKEALKQTTYKQTNYDGKMRHRVVTYWAEELILMNQIIKASKFSKGSTTIRVDNKLASFLISFYDKE